MRALAQIAKEHPALIFNNNGYEYINQSKLSKDDIAALEEVHQILETKVIGYVKFFNFKTNKEGELYARFDGLWSKDPYFIGVCYIKVSDLDSVESYRLSF